MRGTTGLRRVSGRLGRASLALMMIVAVAAPPAAARSIEREDERSAVSSARVGPFTFAVGAYDLRRLPIERLPYNGTSIVESCGLTDSSGVAIYKAADGNYYNHPVAQARCAINMMRNYRLSPEQAYLDQAAANAQRLLDLSVTHQGGTFFPYPFNYSNPNRGRMISPWYSAMAQGQALTTFVRLFEWTGDARWRDAAHGAFASFKVARSEGSPWVVGVEDGMLWLDEYPSTPLDRVFNGHNFSMYGLYDYWRLTGSDEARTLALGAIHSSSAMVSRLRIPGGISQYCVSQKCLDHRVRNPAYHVTHIGQMRMLFSMTGYRHFASTAEALTADSPVPGAGRTVLAAGVHDGYTFDAAGTGTRVLRVTLPSATSFVFGRREVPGARSHPGNGIWLQLRDGPLAGLWVRESDRARPLGFVDWLDFWTGRNVDVEAGVHVGTTYAEDGTPTGTSDATTPAARWGYTLYARVNGSPSVLLSSGPLAGTWLTLGARTTRDTTLFADVDGSEFRGDIIWLTTKEITRGCQTFRYCPTAAVTREQMASFLARALDLPATTRDYFSDDEGRAHEGDANRLAAAGITAGCASGRFCPGASVTREQMASFLARALRLPNTTSDYFVDDEGTEHEWDINRLAAAAVTRGCEEDRYCPRLTVTRGQMAAFIHRALAP